jgi:hypothetical protein
MKWAKRMFTRYHHSDTKIATNHVCPICKRDEDSCGHMLGGCQHTLIKGLVIKRHDNTVKHIRSLLYLSQFQHAFTIMDASGEKEKPKRLPHWLLPHSDTHDRSFRPDILVMEGTTDTDIAQGIYPSPTDGKHYRIHILEIGYCPDTRMKEKFGIKEQQHELLSELLTNQGWQVAPIHPLLFGVGGSIYNDTISYLNTLLHTQPYHLDNTLKAIHINAVHKAHQMVTTRRWIERTQRHHHHTHNTAD